MKYEVLGLHKFTMYNVSVKAFTTIGAGSDAHEQVKTSEDSKFLLPEKAVVQIVFKFDPSFSYLRRNKMIVINCN